MKLATWNVNGIRACAKKGLYEWIKKNRPDIICFQETKATEEQAEEVLKHFKNYDKHFFSAQKKGYSGVGILSKKNTGLIDIKLGLGIEKFDYEGRTIIAEYDNFVLITGYFPNGQRDHGRVPYKLEFSEEMMKRALKIKKEKNKEVIICGDYNTAHKAIDLKNPKTNKDTTGFLPIEREWIDKHIKKGFVDTFRHLNGDIEEQYTWWSYRSNCRVKNVGWRIDYFFVTEGLTSKLKKCWHDTKALGSDHCPVFLELK